YYTWDPRLELVAPPSYLNPGTASYNLNSSAISPSLLCPALKNVYGTTYPLATALTLGQTSVTSLSLSSAVKVAINTGDQVIIGSGATQQTVVASAPAAIGATSISVNSFTSTFAQPIGTLVTGTSACPTVPAT
ncbi:MAG TPA: hypothetical protein VHU17_20985, partial [Acidimicrobiales bacterium]|nr:hypothetical protein [Acidimicrobiales bacterium]